MRKKREDKGQGRNQSYNAIWAVSRVAGACLPQAGRQRRDHGTRTHTFKIDRVLVA